MAIVPQQRLSSAKSRLDLPELSRQRLARAMLQDTVVALSGVPSIRMVLIAWADPEDKRRMPRLPKVANVVVSGNDLNRAISEAEEALAERIPPCNRAVFPGDLPGCDRGEVAELLGQAAGAHRTFLRDAEGSGTTVLTARDRTRLSPHYGHRSAGHHLASGAHSLDVSGYPALSRDVDTLADLRTALSLGVGAFTQAVARELGPLIRGSGGGTSPTSRWYTGAATEYQLAGSPADCAAP